MQAKAKVKAKAMVEVAYFSAGTWRAKNRLGELVPLTQFVKDWREGRLEVVRSLSSTPHLPISEQVDSVSGVMEIGPPLPARLLSRGQRTISQSGLAAGN